MARTPKPWRRAAVGLCGAALAACAGCRNPIAKKKPPPPGRYLTAEAKEVSKLSEREYLMRRATVGTRSERVEALDVIDRSGDPEYLPFLVKRLEKEDDRFLQIRIIRALSREGGPRDVRAVPPMRAIARRYNSRVAIEAISGLYQLGDDNYVPRLIRMMRQNEEYPELSGLAHDALKRLYKVKRPPNPRTWNNYYRTHRLAPYQKQKWYAAFRPPLPPTVAGTSKVVPQPKGGPKRPKKEVHSRRNIVSFYEFWKPDQP